MECSRCCLQPVVYAFTQANLENSMGRIKTKQIISAVEKLKGEFSTVCEKCRSLPSETNRIVDELKETWNGRYRELVKSIQKDSEDLMPAIRNLQTAFQSVCLTCSRVSNDDNPSNHGQTFVSLDSGYCQANSGKAATTHTDDNIVQSRADWISLHAAPDVDDKTYGMSPLENIALSEEPDAMEALANKTKTSLPAEVEDSLMHVFSDFVQLDIIDKILLCCILSGMSVSEFAKMLWMPYSLVDPATRKMKSITKQAAHARWVNIVKKFPIFTTMAISSTKDSRQARAKLVAFLKDPNSEKADDRFKNGKLATKYAKEEARAKELEAKRLAKEREEAEKAKAKKERQRKKEAKQNREKNQKLFPEAGFCLPGMEGLC